MKDYLLHFFEEFEFEKADVQELFRCYDCLMEEKSAAQEWEELLICYERSYQCDFDALLKRADAIADRLSLQEYTLQFLLLICLSKSLWAHYRKAGIDRQICHDTLLDLKYKLEECKLVKGICGTFVGHWFRHAFSLNLFALGRLQFEKSSLIPDLTPAGLPFKSGHPVLSVHIPRSLQPLDRESCQKSYARAAEFFKDYTGEPCLFICYSWLLNPAFSTILPAKSNILSFMSDYHILRATVDIDRSNLWRVFDTDEKNPSRLPTDSSLRRCLVDYLLKGGKLVEGYGLYIYQ